MQNNTYQNILTKGYILNNYEILFKLGEGGFGITYKARHIHLETIVVIKEYMPTSMAIRDRDNVSITVISQENQDEYKFGLKKFLKEAKVLASFKHSNIVGINDFFETNNTAYFVMPFVDGLILGEYVLEFKDNFKTEDQLLNLIVPILEGLREAHSKKILHRDIKLDNIFISENGTPILIDFGTARIDFTGKSKSINVILTPPYAPPEQYGNGKQGPWTDIYALGMVLYKLVTELPATDIPPSIDRVNNIYSGDNDPLIPINNINISGDFNKLILKALSINAKDRFQSAVEMIEAFMNLLENNKNIKIDSPKKNIENTIMVNTKNKIVKKNKIVNIKLIILGIVSIVF